MLKGLGAGRYVVRSWPVKLQHPVGGAKRGATARPVKTTVSFYVRPRRTTAGTVGYGTIQNPGVLAVGGTVSVAGGPSTSPTSVGLNRTERPQVGEIVSAPPTAELPHGLLARVTTVSGKPGAWAIGVAPAKITDVLPNAQFDIPLTMADGGSARRGLSCTTTVHNAISGVHLEGGWTTVSVLGAKIKVGVHLDLVFHDAPSFTLGEDLSCGADVKVPIQGDIAGIPVYGAIGGDFEADYSPGTSLTFGGSMDVRAGFTTVGVPPALVWLPTLQFSNEHFGAPSKGSVAKSGSASIGLGVELGIGTVDVNLHVQLDNKLTFTMGPTCDLTLRMGQFSGVAAFGPFSAATPSTPPLAQHRFWKGDCGWNAGQQTTGGGSPGSQSGSSGNGPSGSGGSGTSSIPPRSYDHVTPLAPASGPVGYDFSFGGPDCAGQADEKPKVQVDYSTGFGSTDSEATYSNTPGAALTGWDLFIDTDSGSAGSYSATVSCLLTNGAGTRTAWTESLPFTITGPARPAQLASQPHAGGSVDLISGASAGSDPCPHFDGLSEYAVDLITGFPDTQGQSGEQGKQILSPTGTTTVSKPLPAYVQTGAHGRAGVECEYYGAEYGSSYRVAFFNFEGTTYTVG